MRSRRGRRGGYRPKPRRPPGDILIDYVEKTWPSKSVLFLRFPLRQSQLESLSELSRRLFKRELYQVSLASDLDLERYKKVNGKLITRRRHIRPADLYATNKFDGRAYLVTGIGAGNVEIDRLIDWARGQERLYIILLTSDYSLPGAITLARVEHSVHNWNETRTLREANDIVKAIDRLYNKDRWPLVIYGDGLVNWRELSTSLGEDRVFLTTDGQEYLLKIPEKFHVIDFAQPRHYYLQSYDPDQRYRIGSRQGLNQFTRFGNYFYVSTSGVSIPDINSLPPLPNWTQISPTFIHLYIDSTLLNKIGYPDRRDIIRLSEQYQLGQTNPQILALPLGGRELSLVALASRRGIPVFVTLLVIALMRNSETQWFVAGASPGELLGETQLETALRVYIEVNHRVGFPRRIISKWQLSARQTCTNLGIVYEVILNVFQFLSSLVVQGQIRPWRVDPKATDHYFRPLLTTLFPTVLRYNIAERVYVDDNQGIYRLPESQNLGTNVAPMELLGLVTNDGSIYLSTIPFREYMPPYVAPFYRWVETRKVFLVEKEHTVTRRRAPEIITRTLRSIAAKVPRVEVSPAVNYR